MSIPFDDVHVNEYCLCFSIRSMHKPLSLTHFQPIFDLGRGQVVGFYYQNVWKTTVKQWHFGSKNQLLGLSIIGTLVEMS